MKLGDNLTNPVALIDQLYANGAAAVVLFNRFYQPDINIENMEHMSGEIFSNASDLANPLRWIGIASAVVDKIDYAASGGVANPESVVKAILAGLQLWKCAVQSIKTPTHSSEKPTVSSPPGWKEKDSTISLNSKAD